MSISNQIFKNPTLPGTDVINLEEIRWFYCKFPFHSECHTHNIHLGDCTYLNLVMYLNTPNDPEWVRNSDELNDPPRNGINRFGPQQQNLRTAPRNDDNGHYMNMRSAIALENKNSDEQRGTPEQEFLPMPITTSALQRRQTTYDHDLHNTYSSPDGIGSPCPDDEPDDVVVWNDLEHRNRNPRYASYGRHGHNRADLRQEHYNNSRPVQGSSRLPKSRSARSLNGTNPEDNGNSQRSEDLDGQIIHVTKQLELIQETQNSILAELSDNLANMQFENAQLKNTNEHLTMQNSHLLQVIQDLSNEVEHMRGVFRARGWALKEEEEKISAEMQAIPPVPRSDGGRHPSNPIHDSHQSPLEEKTHGKGTHKMEMETKSDKPSGDIGQHRRRSRSKERDSSVDDKPDLGSGSGHKLLTSSGNPLDKPNSRDEQRTDNGGIPKTRSHRARSSQESRKEGGERSAIAASSFESTLHGKLSKSSVESKRIPTGAARNNNYLIQQNEDDQASGSCWKNLFKRKNP